MTSPAETRDPYSASRYTDKKFMTVNGRRMAYVDVGAGDPIVFLHGNPTSSFLWRNVMPHLEGRGRLIAPDLIGMGDSEKLPQGDSSRYTLSGHSNYLFKLLDQLGVRQNVTLVVHDWGSVLGFLWAYQHRFDPSAVRGIAFMESIVMPFRTPNRIPSEGAASFITQLRAEAGEELVLRQNLLIKQMLPGGIIRKLTEAEKVVYEQPWLEPGESRRPMLTFARQVPLNGTPEDVVDIVHNYGTWLKDADVPKLFIRANPGTVTQGPFYDFVRSWKNVHEVEVAGLHFVQEDSPDDIGRAINNWLPNRDL